MSAVMILDDDDDPAFQADLARAIAASLEPDGSNDDASPAGGGGGGDTGVWGSLLAASAVARLGAGAGAGRAASDTDSVRAGRCTPALLSSDDDEGEEDDAFERQLAAAKAASLLSVEEDQRRRWVGDGTVAVGASGTGAGAGEVGDAGAGQRNGRSDGGFAPWEVRTTVPSGEQWPQHAFPYQGLGHVQPHLQPNSQPMQRPAAPPSSPTAPRPAADGAVWCPSGLRLHPLDAAAALTSPFALAAATAAPALATNAPAPPPLSAADAAVPSVQPSRPVTVAATQGPAPAASLPLARSAPLPSSPRLVPAHAAEAGWGVAQTHLGDVPPHPAPPMCVATSVAAGCGAALDPLSSSPGKHARTPSLAGLVDQAAPRQHKRSRPASDSGVPAAAAGPSPAHPHPHAHSEPPEVAAPLAPPPRGRRSTGGGGGSDTFSPADALCQHAPLQHGHQGLPGAPTLSSWEEPPGQSCGVAPPECASSWPHQAHSHTCTQSPERPASAASTASGGSASVSGPAPGSGCASSGPGVGIGIGTGWGVTVTTTEAAAVTVTVAPPADILLGAAPRPEPEPHAPRPVHAPLDLGRHQLLDFHPPPGLPHAHQQLQQQQQQPGWQQAWQSGPGTGTLAPAAPASVAPGGLGGHGGGPRPSSRAVAPPLDLSEPPPAGTGAAALPLAPAAAPPVTFSAADRRLLLHQRVWWWLGPGRAQPGSISSIDRRSEPLLFHVRLDCVALGGGGSGGGGGEEVIATADCLLPFVSHGERLMCRLPPPPPAADVKATAAVQGAAGCSLAGGLPLRSWEEAEAEAAAAAVLGSGGAPLVPPSAQACAWVQGTLQYCDFDGPAPRVHVLLEPEGLPYALPYEYVVPVSDAAEGSGCSSSGGGLAGGGVSGGLAGNVCMDIVPVA